MPRQSSNNQIYKQLILANKIAVQIDGRAFFMLYSFNHLISLEAIVDDNKENLSLKKAVEVRDALLAEAELGWCRYLKQLELLIPASMHAWAQKKEFVETIVLGERLWNLPRHIDSVVEAVPFTKDGYPGGVKEKYFEAEVEPYGFATLEDFKCGFLELAAVWDGIIRIRLVHEEYKLEVWYYAAELTPEWPLDESNDEE